MARKNILVVDDEKLQREIYEAVLTEAGYEVTTAASGEAAVKFLDDRKFDLILTDLKMTGITGLDLLHQVMSRDSSISVILITGHGTIELAKESLRSGAFDFLEKPVDQQL